MVAASKELKENFDYVIVGGGTAGALLASRLSEDGKTTVCLLEAGDTDWHPFIHIPAGYIKNVYSKKFTWGFESEPSAGTGGRKFALPQGRVLGGSSSINGLNYVRGQHADFDHWAELGNKGWSYSEVLPFFKKSERRIGEFDKDYRGDKGELPITDLDWQHPLLDGFIKGAMELGLPYNPDHNAATQAGVGTYQRAIYRGRRMSSAAAFLRPVKSSRKNLVVRTNAMATSIIFEGKRAVGIRYKRGGQNGSEHEIGARCEVVLSAGAVNTPKLLQISGVGPENLLRKLGVKIVKELPGVGENLRDHYAIRMVARAKDTSTINNMVTGLPLVWQVMRWMMGKPSLLAVSPSLVSAFWMSEKGMANPDVQFTFTPASFREGVVGLLDKYPGMTCGVWQCRPESLGYVRAVSNNAFDRPQIQPNYLSHEVDQRALIGGIRLARKFMTAPALSKYYEKEISPGADKVSDQELLSFAQEMGTTVYHLIGSARMAPETDPLAVVDSELKPYGLDGLRIVDASIMPTMPSANTNATTMMIAEKGADLILRSRRNGR